MPPGWIDQALTGAAAYLGHPLAGAPGERTALNRQGVMQSAQALADRGHGGF
jgi:hypothetical protein